MKHHFFHIAVLCALLAALSACASPAASVSVLPPQSSTSASQSTQPPSVTLYEGANPLTGQAEEHKPASPRPLAVMIDNVKAALPQRGLAEADIVYEMVTESGITRLMAVYSDYTQMPDVGPVRSARDQHVQLMLPLGAMYLHVGGSTYADAMLATYQYEDKSVNGSYESGALQLDNDRSTVTSIEHCWFTNSALFSAAAKEYHIDTQQKETLPAFQFMPYDAPPRVLTDGDAVDVYLRFSSYANTALHYDAATNRYLKSQFDMPQIDENTDAQISFDNVLVLFTDITKYPDGILANVDFAFGGVGFYINGGRYEKVRWLKGSPEAPLRIVSLDGTETPVALNPGTSYVAMVDLEKYPYFKMAATSKMPGPDVSQPVDNADMQEAPDTP